MNTIPVEIVSQPSYRMLHRSLDPNESPSRSSLLLSREYLMRSKRLRGFYRSNAFFGILGIFRGRQ